MSSTTAPCGPSPEHQPDADTDRESRIESAFDRLGEALHRYVLVRAGGDAHLADDVMQHVWLAAMRDAPASFDEIEPWLRRVARDALNDHWRRRRRRSKHLPLADADLATRLARDLEAGPIPPRLLGRREVRDQILLALTALPAETQDLLAGHYFHGRTLAQLAAASGRTERAVEGRLYRARQAMKESLSQLRQE